MKKQVKNLLLAVFMLVLGFSGVTSVAAEENEKKTGLKPFEVEATVVEDENDIEFKVYSNSKADINYWTKFSSRYYYNMLSKEEKQVWDQLESACIAFATGNEYGDTVNVSVDGASLGWGIYDVQNFLMKFKYTNPQYYFLESRVGYSYTGSGEIVGITVCVYPAFQDAVARAAVTEQFMNRINVWVQQVATGARLEDKVKIAHDIIAQNTVYEFGTYDQSAYSMVCEGKTVCAGYTAALQLLLNPNGVETVEVTSYDHAWNLVNLHGYWYNVDVTWDDTDFDAGSPQAYYDCYLKSNATLIEEDGAGSHTAEAFWNGVAPVSIYDSTLSAWDDYYSSYFVDGNYTYFKVNDNTNRGNYMATVVESWNGALESNAPQTVKYDGNNYVVLAKIQETPDTTPDETPDTTPDETPDTTPDETPDTIPDETPDTTPDETPDTTPDETPDTTPDETPDTTPNETPDEDIDDTEILKNGLIRAEDGNWYYWVNGKVDKSFSGLYCDVNVGWWLVRDGKVAFDYNGLWGDSQYGWWKVAGGAVDFNYTGLYCDANVGWWLIGGGRVCFEYNGLWGDPQYGWWLVNGGAVDFGYTGLYYDANCGWWLIGGGRVCFEYNGLWGDPQYGWWLVNGGTIPFEYTGLYYDTNCGWWYVQNGAVGFGYTGEVYYNGVPYYVVNGCLI